jgi:hypothetical protein
MSTAPMVKVKAATAAEICARFDVKDDARALLREGMTPREFVEALSAKKQYIAAIDFMAHALPPREAIWWGCLCFQHAFGNDLPAPDRAAAKAAVEWVLHPGEEPRAAARAPGETAGPSSAAGSLALAAFQTGGNVAPPKAPAMSPAPFAPAKAAATAVKLASIKSEPIKLADTQRLYVELGIGVAEGRFL